MGSDLHMDENRTEWKAEKRKKEDNPKEETILVPAAGSESQRTQVNVERLKSVSTGLFEIDIEGLARTIRRPKHYVGRSRDHMSIFFLLLFLNLLFVFCWMKI